MNNPQLLKINNLDCLCALNRLSQRTVYVLYPMDILTDWVADAAKRYDANIVVITGMDWQDDLTPWPEKGVPRGTPDFLGRAPEFLTRLQDTVLALERQLRLPGADSRSLVGVSLSGLFTLWQWPQTPFFRSIGSLSGSFWYEGFAAWIASQDFSGKTGRAYFLLGDREPYSNVREFNTVGVNTQQIVNQLKARGVRVKYDIVAGNHFQFPIERLELAFQALT